MNSHLERDPAILPAIGEGRRLTQRALADRLGVALGLTSLYLEVADLVQRGFPREKLLTLRRPLPQTGSGR